MRTFLTVFLIIFAATVAIGAVSSFYIVDDSGQKIPFGTGGELHFENISGVPGHITVFAGTADISAHTGDTTIHFTEDSIDHTAIQNIGFYSHTSIDNHLDDGTIHFLQSEINHDNLLNVGIYGHDQLDAHVVDSTVHFLESSIDHTAIQNIGFYSHTSIDNHVDDSTIHAPIDDSLTTSTSTLWSSDYTKDYVDDNSGGSASIPTGTIWMYGGSTAPSGWSVCDGDALDTTTEADLFAVIGYTYGGSGSTFYEPDFRGRTGIGVGQGDGLSSRSLGEMMGEEAHSLSDSENGPHTHGNIRNRETDSGSNYNNAATAGSAGSGYTASSGLGDPHNTMQPSIVINYIIKY